MNKYKAIKFTKRTIILLALAYIVNMLGPLGVVQMLMMVSILIGQFALIFWFMSRVGAEEIIYPEDIETTWDDVWGQDNAVKRLQEVEFFLKNPETIESKGGTVPRGVLLWGPPGTGKTLMAKALAKSVNRPFVLVGPGALTSMFFGVNILKVKRIFRKARKLSLEEGGCILFFDEMDSLGNRGAAVQGHGWLARIIDGIIVGGGMGQMGTLEILLAEMDGLTKSRGITTKIRKLVGLPVPPPPKYRILVLGATNLPQRLDPALLRPGRLDRKIKVSYPDRDGRIATFKGYLSKVPHNLSEDDIITLADNNPYATGAVIKDAVNEALISALQRGSDVVEWRDIRNAIIWKEMGDVEGRQPVEEDQWRVAVHEAAHAVAAHHFRPKHRIQFASVLRRGHTLGVVSSVPVEERFTKTRDEYLADIKVSLASVWAEKRFFNGDLSSGPASDLENANKIAHLMIARLGMGDMLATNTDDKGEPRAPVKKVDRLLHEAYSEMAEFLEARKDQVLLVADLLDKEETVDGHVIHELLERMEQ